MSFLAFCGSLEAATIVLPARPTEVERAAAEELRDAAARMTGRAWPVVSEDVPAPETPCYWIGATRKAGVQTFSFDEILVAPVAGGAVLTGDAARGVLYAVIDYLERDCGVRWWTSTESDYPKRAALPIPAVAHRHVPSFRYREVYYRDALDADFKVRLRSNFASRTSVMNAPQHDVPPRKGGSFRFPRFPGRLSAFHTAFVFVPPERHFAAHPEWFSLVDGKREPKQLCWTNPEMEAVFTANVFAAVRADPGANFIQVSQMDNSCPCTCAACRAIEAEEGGAHAAPMLRFVNRVAEAVEKVNPDIRLDTFAYLYTRRAPTKTRPRHNVTVRLCDIECAYNVPHVAQKGNAFVKDLADWSRVAAGRLFVWTYTTDFLSYMLPHPNYRVLAPNLRLFASQGAAGVFEQGDILCSAGEFARLRTWVLAHLNWDVQADEQALYDEFLRGYYGAGAAPHLKAYLTVLCDAAARPGVGKVGCYHENDPWISFADARTLEGHFAAAERAAAAEGMRYAERVRRERLSLDHLRLLNWNAWRAAARARGLAWPQAESFHTAAVAWTNACTSFGVTAFREFGSGGFAAYAQGLAAVRSAAEPVTLWDAARDRPPEAVDGATCAVSNGTLAVTLPGNRKCPGVRFRGNFDFAPYLEVEVEMRQTARGGGMPFFLRFGGGNGKGARGRVQEGRAYETFRTVRLPVSRLYGPMRPVGEFTLYMNHPQWNWSWEIRRVRVCGADRTETR